MSESEDKSSNKAISNVVNVLKNVASSLMALQKSNPKVFYGVIAVVVVGWFVLSLGEDADTSSVQKNLIIGQTYTVSNPNAPSGGGKTLLVVVPGTFAAYDESGGGEGIACSVPSGSRATVIEKTMGQEIAIPYVKLRIEDGVCAGKEGWTILSNVS